MQDAAILMGVKVRNEKDLGTIGTTIKPAEEGTPKAVGRGS
jgi:hypothetical protein